MSFKACFEAWTLGHEPPGEDLVVFAIRVGGEEGIK